MLRILAIIAPSTASSRSASSKIRNGALPPSSIETLSTFSAAWAISFLPTSVEPVNESFRRRGSPMIGAETPPDEELVITLRTPGGSPHSSSSFAERQHRERRVLRRLDHHRAAGGDRRADLAGAHRRREVPGGDEVAGADGLTHHQHPAGGVPGRLVVAVEAQRLAREPAEELGRVRDLRLRLGDGLAHLQGHQQAPGRRRARSAPRTLGGGSRCARSAGLPPTRPAPPPRRRARPWRRRAWRRRSRTAPRRLPGPRPPGCRHRRRRATRRRSGAAAGPPRLRAALPWRCSWASSPSTRPGRAATVSRGRCRACLSHTPRPQSPRAAWGRRPSPSTSSSRSEIEQFRVLCSGPSGSA